MRLKFFLSIVSVILITVLAMVLILRQGTATQVRAFMTNEGMLTSSELALDLEAWYAQYNTWEGADSLLPVSGHMGMMDGQVMLADADGVIVYGTRGNAPTSLNAEQISSSEALHSPSGEIVGYLFTPSGSGGHGYSGNASSEAGLTTRLDEAALQASLIAAAIGLVLALLLASGLSRPLQKLSKAATQIAQGNLSVRVPAKGRDEVAHLSGTFNQMADSLARLEDQRKAMTADIAHELRTPLAVQRAHLEAIQDGVEKATPETLQTLLEQNQQLTRLVNDLRTLALAEAGELRLEKQPLDPAEVLRTCRDQFEPLAAAKDIHLTVETPPAPCQTLQADPNRLNQVLTNLVTNALQHTPAGGLVTLSLNCTPAGVVEFIIADSGAGISPEVLPHIFERFHKAGSPLSQEQGSTGLGLAIARQLTLAHGGQLTAANRPEGGAQFTVRMGMRE
jgi:signal transduction histidine kinase